MDEGNIIKQQKDVKELDGSISKVTHINIATLLEINMLKLYEKKEYEQVEEY